MGQKKNLKEILRRYAPQDNRGGNKMKSKYTVLSMVIMVGLASAAYAEELSPIEMPSGLDATIVKKPVVMEAVKTHENALNLRVSTMVGLIGSADNNQLLLNKYTAGLAAEVPLSQNLSIEGVFRYALFDIRPELNLYDSTGAVAANNSYFGPSSLEPGAYTSSSTIGEMRQIVLGGNLKYELFPQSILSPFIGGGVAYFNNEYTSQDAVRITLPQSVMGANALAGMKLRLSDHMAIVGQGEAGSLLNNKNGYIYYGPQGRQASIYPRTNFKSYDKYWTAMAGISFGL